MLNPIARTVIRASAALVATLALIAPAVADTDPSGTYRIITGTGKHMIVTIIGTVGGVDGMYVGGGVGGRLHGTYNQSNPNIVNYTWVEDKNDALNQNTKRGWGNMQFSDDATRMQARWGFENQGTSVGLWNATRIDP